MVTYSSLTIPCQKEGTKLQLSFLTPATRVTPDQPVPVQEHEAHQEIGTIQIQDATKVRNMFDPKQIKRK